MPDKLARDRVRDLLADRAHSLDEVQAQVQEEYPGVDVPAITSLHRERRKIEAWARRRKEADAMVEAWLKAGTGAPESSIGKLLQETLRTLAFNAADQMQTGVEAGQVLDVKAVANLSRAFLAIENGARISAERERELIAEGERRAAEKLGEAAKSIGITADQARQLRLKLGGAAAA